MKVVLFCGGLGLRLRDYSGDIPKPMVNIGHRPILWHIMKYYAYYGHKEFILCLGYKGKSIKDYFLNYDECVSNNFTIRKGGKNIELASRDINDWTISFVDTGMTSSIGERLLQVKDYVDGEEMFLANYSDNLTDFHLPNLVNKFKKTDNVAGFLCVKPSHTFHVVETEESTSKVTGIKDVQSTNMMLNGGYFVLRKEIFDYMNYGEELVIEAFQRLIKANKLMAYKYRGFWACMDTFKEKKCLEDLSMNGGAVWKVWQNKPKKRKLPIKTVKGSGKEELINA